MNVKVSDLEYFYSKIPIKYLPVYKAILELLSDYGEQMLKDCKIRCADRSENVVECFNMFNGALASYNLGDIRKADLIINYVAAKINQIGCKVGTDFNINLGVESNLPVFVTGNKDNPDIVLDDTIHEYFRYVNRYGFLAYVSNTINVETGKYTVGLFIGPPDGENECTYITYDDYGHQVDYDSYSEYFINNTLIPYVEGLGFEVVIFPFSIGNQTISVRNTPDEDYKIVPWSDITIINKLELIANN